MPGQIAVPQLAEAPPILFNIRNEHDLGMCRVVELRADMYEKRPETFRKVEQRIVTQILIAKDRDFVLKPKSFDLGELHICEIRG